MLGLMLLALAIAEPLDVPLLVVPAFLAVIVLGLHVTGNSQIRNGHSVDDEDRGTARRASGLITPVSYNDLFLGEVSVMDSTLSGFIHRINRLETLSEQERNRARDLRAWQIAREDPDSDEYIRLTYHQHSKYDFKLFCNVVLLLLYLTFSAGLWRLLLASLRACHCSVSQPCLLVWAPARSGGVALASGMFGLFVLGVYWASQTRDSIVMLMLPTITLLGAWVGAVAKALCFATFEFVSQACFDHPNNVGPDFEELMQLQLLPHGPHLLSPHQCRYSQSSIASAFRDGVEVHRRREIHQYAISACFHEGMLFTLNNRTLYSAVMNDIGPIKVTIVEKPSTWSSRFTAQPPYTSVRVRSPPVLFENIILEAASYSDALTIPAAAFPRAERQAEGYVVLEVNKIVNPRQPQSNTLVMILRERCPGFNIEEVEGDRNFARARIRIADEEVVRAVIKAVGRERRKRVTITEVSGSRVFLSPRD